MRNKLKIDLNNYTRGKTTNIDGVPWYTNSKGKPIQTVESHARKNLDRMIVNGKVIPKYLNKEPGKRKGDLNPLHKPGNYKSLDSAWSHEEIEKVKEGQVYGIVNTAWENWIKVGKAVDTEDRLKGYQTSSPFRDYKILTYRNTNNRGEAEKKLHKVLKKYAKQKKGEWFNINKDTFMALFHNTQLEGETI